MGGRLVVTPLALLMLVSQAVVLGDEEAEKTITRLVPVKYLSAEAVARAATGDATPAKYADFAEARTDFVRRALTDATRPVRPFPEMQQPGLYPFPERNYAEARVAQAVQPGGTLASLLPEDLTEPPVAVPAQNALIVKGTAKAIDEFVEILALLDKPPKQVNIEVTLVNIRQSRLAEWGPDLHWRFRKGDVWVQGPAPPGSTLQYATGSLSALITGSQQRAFSDNSVSAQVTTTNNTPCVIRAVTVIPFVAASVTYNMFGQRQVDYMVDAVVTGVELFVIPRINADDTVTMLLRPTFIDKAGQVLTPSGSPIPITQEITFDTQVTVKDGETLFIGGFPRSIASLETVGLPLIFRRSASVEDSETLLFVTPRIVRSLNP